MLATSVTDAPYTLNTVRTPSRSYDGDNTSPLQFESQVTSSFAEMTNDDEISNFPSSPVTQSSPLSNNIPSDVRRKKRATAKNPIYGHVTGVMRGTSSPHGKFGAYYLGEKLT